MDELILTDQQKEKSRTVFLDKLDCYIKTGHARNTMPDTPTVCCVPVEWKPEIPAIPLTFYFFPHTTTEIFNSNTFR